ncbi:MYXO-CTERM sorting domain-containing protein [Nannocystis bainbridge]|uniref:MYXO-CTERM sorting domain-containing protein n=1 Tax=Nannocystis bainbridge TaxID=2995303 RepID=A0ABT5E3D5_9BACT|nr:MYXO-CTERM sorting domain-containing protein [Nannocystis bainbridge]MDC0720379.1 MYXO-CTERM sorting domain-containing protein [Nannocystis bainbridge]
MLKTPGFRRFVQGTALIGACALSGLVARPAEACGPPPPGLESSLPVDGTTHPGNAALLFNGYYIKLDDVTVTVDGEPATLVPADFGVSLAAASAFVEPAPTEGQVVVVSGTFCDPGECEPTTITYTASADDVGAPAPIVDASFFAVYDHRDFVSSGGDCQSDTDLTFYFHLGQTDPAPGDPTFFTIAWDPDGEGPLGVRRTVRADGDALVARVGLHETQLGSWDPQKLCFEVSAIDAAGNAAEPFELCSACYARTDDIAHEIDSPAEPDWTEADAVPGSACASEVQPTTGEETDTGPTTGDTSGDATGDATGDTSSDSDSAGGDDDGKGCACSSDGGDPSDAARFLLFVLGLGLALVKRRG